MSSKQSTGGDDSAGGPLESVDSGHSEAADLVEEYRERIDDELTSLEDDLRSGEGLSREDELNVQRLFHDSADNIIGTVQDHVGGDEPKIVAELRSLALETNGALLYAALHLNSGNQLSPRPYRFNKEDVAWAFALYDLLGDYGAVAPAGEIDGEVDPETLSVVVDTVDSADGVSIEHSADSRALFEGWSDAR